MKHLLIALALLLGLMSVGIVEESAAQERFYREVTLDAANTVTADEQSAASEGFANASIIAMVLSCTENSGTATLDVAIQRSLDGGTTWVDIIAYTQLSATGAETLFYGDEYIVGAGVTPTTQMIGDRLRVDYDITGTGNWTCGVKGVAEG